MIVAKAKEHGKGRGHVTMAAPEYALKRIDMGFQFVTVASDARLMASGAQAVLSDDSHGGVPTRARARTVIDQFEPKRDVISMMQRLGFIGLGHHGQAYGRAT